MRSRIAHSRFGVHSSAVFQQQFNAFLAPLQARNVQWQRARRSIYIGPMALQQPSRQLDVIDADTFLQQIVTAFIVNGQYVFVLQGEERE